MSVEKFNKEIMGRVGIALSTVSKNGNQIYYIIYWPDGSIRWIFSVAGLRPGFLAFYPAFSIRSRFGAWSMRLLGLFGLMGFLAEKKDSLELDAGSLISKALVKYQCDGWALFAGTPGIDRKIVVSLSNGKKTIKYIKIPISAQSHKLIGNELYRIKQLEKLKLKSVIIPYAEEMTDALVVDNVNTSLTRSSFNLTSVHLNGLSEIFSVTNKKISLNKYIEQNKFIEKLNVIKKITALDQKVDVEKVAKIADETLKRIYDLLASRAEEQIYVCFAHRDFTPWNSFVLKDRLVLIDLELSNDESHIGFDFLHFLVQKELMTSRNLQLDNLLIYVKKRFLIFLSDQQIFFDDKQIQTCIFLYFLHQSTYYIPKYLQQSNVHYQAILQINMWNDILLTHYNWSQL